jgi:hypothetical protein
LVVGWGSLIPRQRLVRAVVGDTTFFGCHAYAGDSDDGLRDLGLGFRCERRAAPALAGLSELTRLTRLRLALAGQASSVGDPHFTANRIKLSRKWSGSTCCQHPCWT